MPFRGIARNPGYGLGKLKKTYRQVGQSPARPPIRSWRRLLRPPYTEASRRRSVARGRALLLAAAVGLLLVSALFFTIYEDALAPIPAVAGLAFVVLFGFSGRHTVLTLKLGAVLFATQIPVVLLLLFTAGSDDPFARVIQSVVPALAFVVSLVVLVALIAAEKAARAIGDPQNPVT